MVKYMNNLIDIYTKINLKLGSMVVVTYYKKDGLKHTEEAPLLDIISFSHIWIGKGKNDMTSLSFFSPEVIIESITFKGDRHPTYVNPYLQNGNMTNPFACYSQLERLMQPVIHCDKKALEKRREFVKKYLKKDDYVEYDDLFFSQKQKEEFEACFNMLVKELSAYAVSKNLDGKLKRIWAGTTSIIYEIGDKIVKIGKPRRVSTIPYCEYILQPIINQTLTFDGYPIQLEVTQKVLTLEEFYQCGYDEILEKEEYKAMEATLLDQLEAIGLSFSDSSPSNIGILIEDNRIHYDEIGFATANEEVTSIENNNGFRILQKGMPVIIDLDCIEIKDRKKYAKYLKSITGKQGKRKK